MGAKTDEVYVCKVCGNKVKFLEAGGGVLVCCGVPIKLLAGNQ